MPEPIGRPGEILKVRTLVNTVPLVRCRLEMRNENPPYDLLLVGDTFNPGGFVVHAKIDYPEQTIATDYMDVYFNLARQWEKLRAQREG